MKAGGCMDATLRRLDLLIMTALEHLDYLRGTRFEKYAEDVLDSLVCQRERYTHYLSLLN
jgi:hypothetical protein